MLQAISIAVKAFFGGGSSVVYAAAIVAAGAFYFHYTDIVDDKKELKKQVVQMQTYIDNQQTTLKSQHNQLQRKETTKTKQDADEETIRKIPDSNRCSTSEPIRATLNLMRDEWTTRNTSDNSD